MRLIDDWKACWKMLSVQANSVGIAISGAYTLMYEQLKDNFPPKYMLAVTGVVFVFGILGRVISQTPPDKPE